jgi:dCMP deaminase
MPNQKALDMVFVNVAEEIAKLSTCVHYKVAAVIVSQGRIISMGYNGTPEGCDSCCEIFTQHVDTKGASMTKADKEVHHRFSEKFEIHAEQNAILFAAKYGIAVNGATLYSTLQPCNTCVKLLCQSGIKRVVYGKPYPKSEYDDEVLNMLKISGLTIEKLEREHIAIFPDLK